jgi:hypothetical protein
MEKKTKINNSNDGFQTKVWGSPLWFFLHIISLNYSPKKKKWIQKVFRSFKICFTMWCM